MNNFQYYNPSRIIFCAGSEQELGFLLKEYHVISLLLVYSGDFIKNLGIYTLVKKSCVEQNIAFYEDGRVVPNAKSGFSPESDCPWQATCCGIS